jgi:hypothetical protein
VWSGLTAPKTSAERRDRLLLWQEVRAAKESLSRISTAPVHVPGYQTDLHLTREELEAVAAPLLNPIGELVTQVVAAAGLTPDRLAGVLLVGGGSRIPLLARLLHTCLAVAPTVVERPETVVAEGALHALPAEVSPDQPGEDEKDDGVGAPAVRTRRRRPLLSPAALLLVLVCFLLPFASVSCGLPGGYGRAQPGGSTTYTGLDLVVGGTPDVHPPEQLRPPSERGPDRLGPQPVLLLALLTTVAAAVVAVAVRAPRPRRVTVAALATTAALFLAAGQEIVLELLAARVQAQSAVPAGRTARDFVGTGIGFRLALGLLTIGALANVLALVPWARLRRGKSAQERQGQGQDTQKQGT